MFWHVVLKGIFGSLLIVMVFPVLCILLCVTSIVLAVTTPVWMPIAVFIVHLFYLLVYDFDSPGTRMDIIYFPNYFPWNIIYEYTVLTFNFLSSYCSWMWSVRVAFSIFLEFLVSFPPPADCICRGSCGYFPHVCSVCHDV